MEQMRRRGGDGKILGAKGEKMVAGFLANNGYNIVAKNWRCRHLEIDIIAVKDNTVHFVEVKSLSCNELTEPYRKVGNVKRGRIIDAANCFLNSKCWYLFLHMADMGSDFEVSFDVASVVGCAGTFTVEFFENAYTPLW